MATALGKLRDRYLKAGYNQPPAWTMSIKARILKFSTSPGERRAAAGSHQAAQRDGAETQVTTVLRWALAGNNPPGMSPDERLKSAIRVSGWPRDPNWVCIPPPLWLAPAPPPTLDS